MPKLIRPKKTYSSDEGEELHVETFQNSRKSKNARIQRSKSESEEEKPRKLRRLRQRKDSPSVSPPKSKSGNPRRVSVEDTIKKTRRISYEVAAKDNYKYASDDDQFVASDEDVVESSESSEEDSPEGSEEDSSDAEEDFDLDLPADSPVRTTHRQPKRDRKELLKTLLRKPSLDPILLDSDVESNHSDDSEHSDQESDEDHEESDLLLRNLDEDDEDLVVEDDEATDVVLPVEFSMKNKLEGPEMMARIVEFMIRCIISPEFGKKAKDYPRYTTVLDAMEKRVRGSTSGFISSQAWQPAFKVDLDKYPTYKTSDLEIDDVFCEACGRYGHPASVLIILKGPLADPFSANPKNKTEDLEQLYKLGSHCFHRTRTYHSLKHWRTGIRKQVLRAMERFKVEWKSTSLKEHDDSPIEVGNWRWFLQELEHEGLADQLYNWIESEIDSAPDWKVSGEER